MDTATAHLDGSVITDLEDTAFKLGVQAGIASESHCGKSFLQITRHFLEFGAPQIPYHVIGYLDPETPQFLYLGTHAAWDPGQRCLELIGKGRPGKSRPLQAIPLEDKSMATLAPDSLKLDAVIEVPLSLKRERLGTLFIFSPEGAESVWKACEAEEALQRLVQIIVKVARLVQASESYLADCITHIGDGILLLSRQNRIKLINPAARSLLALSQPVDPRREGFILAIFKPLLQEFEARRELISRELTVKYPVERTLKIDIKALRESEEILILLRDVTHYKEVDRMKTEIISTVSHELRTPLTAIDSLTSNLLKGIGGSLTGKQHDYLDRIKNNTIRLSNLINNLLDLSKLEAGEVTLLRDSIDLDEWVSRTLRDMEPRLKAKKIRCRKSIAKNLGPVLADPHQLDQVLMNLVGNAVKFVPEGGHIDIRARKKGKYHEIQIRDNGPGIPEENQQIIFQKFKQVGRVYGAGEKGTGLGLSIAVQIMKLHGGHITLHSPPPKADRGSEFILYLPVKSRTDHLRDALQDRVRHSGVGSQGVTLLRLEVHPDSRKLKDRLDDFSRLMDNVLHAVRGVIKRGLDHALPLDNSGTLLILLITHVAGASAARKRILKAVRETVKRDPHFKPEKTRIMDHVHHYPEEHGDIETLIQAALSPGKKP